MKVPLEFLDLVQTELEGSAADEQADAFDKFLADAALAGAAGGWENAAKLQQIDARLSAPVEAHYRKLAGSAAPQTKPAPSSELAKRFGTDPKKLFRSFFAEQRQLGKTVAQILDRFTDAAREEFADTLRELAAEFGG